MHHLHMQRCLDHTLRSQPVATMHGAACPFVSALLDTVSPVTSTPEPEPHWEPGPCRSGFWLRVLSRAPLRKFHTLMLPSSAPASNTQGSQAGTDS